MTKRTVLLISAAVLLTACGDGGSRDAPPALPSLAADRSVTLSGISSGGYMASQYQLANSASVAGAAIIAAGPWGCAGGEMKRALGECLSGEGIDVESLTGHALSLAENDRIDPVENIDEHRLFFFRGSKDAVIPQPVFAAARSFYADANADADTGDAVQTVDEIPAGHGWVTDSYGAGCEEFESPYIVNCDYDLAGAILTHFYGKLNPPTDAPRALTEFSQAAFSDASLARTGFAYIPDECQQASCRVHVFFHGCEQSADAIGSTLAEHAGFNEWAETNRIIVLYPQVAPSSLAPMNPLGCWDWWGYTGDDYLEQGAPQIAAVHRLVTQLASR